MNLKTECANCWLVVTIVDTEGGIKKHQRVEKIPRHWLQLGGANKEPRHFANSRVQTNPIEAKSPFIFCPETKLCAYITGKRVKNGPQVDW